jgi:hypothetical protein
MPLLDDDSTIVMRGRRMALVPTTLGVVLP